MEPCQLRRVLGGNFKDIQGPKPVKMCSQPRVTGAPPWAAATGRGKGLGTERVWQTQILESGVDSPCQIHNSPT